MPAPGQVDLKRRRRLASHTLLSHSHRGETARIAADTPRWWRWRPSCATPLRNRLRSGRAERAAPLGRSSSSKHDLKRCRQLRPPPLGAAALPRMLAVAARRWPLVSEYTLAGCWRARATSCQIARLRDSESKELSSARIQTHFTLLSKKKNCHLGEKRYRKDWKFTISVLYRKDRVL